MAEDDIYRSRKKYEHFKADLKNFVIPPVQRKYKGKYFCRNPENINYFKQMFIYFEAKDISYIRRYRILQSMKFIANHATKNLRDCDRNDVNMIMANMHNVYISPKSKETFIHDIKYIWKILFPEMDDKGRPDDSIVPYQVRHLSARIDKSRQKIRKDKFSWEEFEKLVSYFNNDPRIQAYLTLSLESLARPQELLYLKVGDVECYKNYAKIFISEHGKEGVGLLQCIDSYPYILKWLNIHPLKHDKQAFLFINTGSNNRCKQMKPTNVNKFIRKACVELNIDKPITCYSLKRNGVTMRRLRGESDVEIQHAARWTSTKQLKTYDLSSQDEAFKIALQKRGLITLDENLSELPKTKICPFCEETIGFSETFCPKCKHPLERNFVLNEKEKDEEIQRLRQSVSNMNSQFENIKNELMQELTREILKAKSG